MPESIALVGAGVIGRRHLKALGETDTADLSAIVDRVPETSKLASDLDVPFFLNTEDMLDAVHPQGVIIATPTEHHLSPAMTALGHGCHLLIEKPIMATLEEAQIISQRSDVLGLHVLVGHHRRYYPQVEMARELVTSGELGRVVAVSGQWCVRKHEEYYAPDWRKRWQAGPVLTNLIHEIDYLRYILGDVVSVQAELSHMIQGFEKEDTAAFLLSFQNGALGAFILSDQADSPWAWEFATGENPAFPRSGQNCIRIIGTEASLDFPNLKVWRSDGDSGSWNLPKVAEEHNLELGDAYIRQIDHFADVIAGRDVPKITALDASATLGVTLAVLEAGNQGTRVLL